MTRIGICGLGNIGKVHLSNLRTLRGCEVAGIYDLRTEEVARIAESHGVRAFASAADMFGNPSVDAVVIATPSHTHRVLTEQALAAGKHVFVEKPLADSLEEAEAMMAASAWHPDRVVQVGFCERFNPQYIEARAAVKAGALGNVRCIHSSRTAPYALGDPKWSLGVLDTAVHNLDLVLWLLDELPATVFARGVEIYPGGGMHSVTTILDFFSGAMVTDTVTWLVDDTHPLSQCARSYMRIIGDAGSFEIDLTSRPSALLSQSGYREIDTVILGGAGYYSCLKLQFEAFLRSIEEGAAVLAPLADAYRAEVVVLSIQHSLQSKTPVTIA